MKKLRELVVRQMMCGLLGSAMLSGGGLRAQAMAAQPGEPQLRVFHLRNVGNQSDSNEILVALRNVLDPRVKIYLVNSTNNIVLSASPDQIALAERLINELDRNKPSYRLTYTLTETDAGKRVGVQHFAMVVLLGQHVRLRQGDKVPVITGSYDTDKAMQQTQFTYLDVGMNLDSTLDSFAGGLRLQSKVEQSSVVEGPTPGVGGKAADDPIVRQSLLEGTAVIVPGKALMLGSLDVVGSTRHVDVEVMAEPLP